jgi:DNA-binding transcriptional regulator YiaG
MKTGRHDATWLAERVREAVPRAKVSVSQPGAHGSVWWVDVELRDRYVVIEWSEAKAFGISTPTDDEPYGLPSSELLADAEDALARVLHLLKTGEPARSRREMELKTLREHRTVSQVDLAKSLLITQATVSKTERRDDLLLSTLRGYIEALGGELQVFARFPHEVIELDLGGEKKS